MDVQELIAIFEKEIDASLPNLSVDCVIFGFDEGALKVLILDWRKQTELSLPGGFVHMDEDLDDAAKRVLRELTGLELPFLEQFGTFGKRNRSDRQLLMKELKAHQIATKKIVTFLKQRFVSVAYVALVNLQSCKTLSGPFTGDPRWLPVYTLPRLSIDHNEIVLQALERVRDQIYHRPICRQVMPETFTMKQLQALYESILGMELARGNFQKRILKQGMLTRLEKQMSGGSHKAPYLYTFHKES